MGAEWKGEEALLTEVADGSLLQIGAGNLRRWRLQNGAVERQALAEWRGRPTSSPLRDLLALLRGAPKHGKQENPTKAVGSTAEATTISTVATCMGIGSGLLMRAHAPLMIFPPSSPA